MLKQKKEPKTKKYATKIVAGKTFMEMIDAAIKAPPRKVKPKAK